MERDLVDLFKSLTGGCSRAKPGDFMSQVASDGTTGKSLKLHQRLLSKKKKIVKNVGQVFGKISSWKVCQALAQAAKGNGGITFLKRSKTTWM